MKNLNEFHANKLKTMLVDGDLLAYKITSALEETIQWEDDVWTLHCDLEKCINFVNNLLLIIYNIQIQHTQSLRFLMSQITEKN